MRPVSDAPDRAAELDRLSAEWQGCQKCALARTRTQVVVGSGHPDSDLMFVGEAPGYHEDRQGAPFVGQAGKVLESLLASIGLSRPDVYIANVLKCRPPGNRDPQPDEIAACEGHLFSQVELIRPRVICTLGNFATKLLSGQPHGITRVHGRAQPRRIAGVDLVLYPIFHPAAALYTPAMMETLKQDFAKLPELLSTEPVVAAIPAAPVAAPVAPPEPVAEPEPEYAQLGLF
jgi:uracil-DNA glycosylase family 4